MSSLVGGGEVDVPDPGHHSHVSSDTGGEVILGSKWIQYAGAAGVFVVGVAAAVGAMRLGYWREGPGPGFFPLWMGVLLAVLSLLWAVQTYRATAVPAEDAAPPGGRRDMLLILVGLAGVVLLLDVIGYQLTMFIFLLFVLLVVTHRGWLEALIVAAVGGFGVYALFANVLQVYLPTASLGPLAQLGL